MLRFFVVLLLRLLVVEAVLGARDPLLELDAAGRHCDGRESLDLVAEEDLIEYVVFSVCQVFLSSQSFLNLIDCLLTIFRQVDREREIVAPHLVQLGLVLKFQAENQFLKYFTWQQ